MASCKYSSTKQTTNAARVSRVVIGPCADVLRDILRKKIPQSEFSRFLKKEKHILKRNLNKQQRTMLYPDRGKYSADYNDFDISILYTFFRNGILPPHAKGWGNTPDLSDRSVSANIERIREIRNSHCGHSLDGSLEDSDFSDIWIDIKQIVYELAQELSNPTTDYVEAVDVLETETMDPEKENQLLSIIDEQKEEDMKTKEVVKEGFRKLQIEIQRKHRQKSSGVKKKRTPTISKLQSPRPLTRSDIHTNLKKTLKENFLAKTLGNGKYFRKWKDNFAKYCGLPGFQSTDVLKDFELMEKLRILAEGKYDILKEILKKVESKAVKEIEKAEFEMKKMKRPRCVRNKIKTNYSKRLAEHNKTLCNILQYTIDKIEESPDWQTEISRSFTTLEEFISEFGLSSKLKELVRYILRKVESLSKSTNANMEFVHRTFQFSKLYERAKKTFRKGSIDFYLQFEEDNDFISYLNDFDKGNLKHKIVEYFTFCYTFLGVDMTSVSVSVFLTELSYEEYQFQTTGFVPNADKSEARINPTEPAGDHHSKVYVTETRLQEKTVGEDSSVKPKIAPTLSKSKDRRRQKGRKIQHRKKDVITEETEAAATSADSKCESEETWVHITSDRRAVQGMKLTIVRTMHEEENNNGISHISHVEPDRWWISNLQGRIVLKNDRDCEREEIETKLSSTFGIHAISHDGFLLFLHERNSVKKFITRREIQNVINTDMWDVKCVYCSLNNGDIFVGMKFIDETRITRYTQNGEEVRHIQYDTQQQPLYRDPKYIMETQTGDICASDWRGLLIVVKETGDVRFRHQIFMPCGICIDVANNILVCDGTQKIHVLNSYGQLLKMVETETPGIRALYLDKQHNLYAGNHDKSTIDIYKYLPSSDRTMTKIP